MAFVTIYIVGCVKCLCGVNCGSSVLCATRRTDIHYYKPEHYHIIHLDTLKTTWTHGLDYMNQ
jgi:hypothetical protein